MSSHQTHQMQLTSLYCFFPPYTDEEFNGKFRNKTRIKIIKMLQEVYPNGLTDTEMAKKMGCYPNCNINRPRRNDLSRTEKNKFNRPVIDSGMTKINESGNRETVWVLNPENLNAYMGK